MKKRLFLATAAVAALGMLGLSASASAGTLQDVQQRGKLKCGVNVGLPGFSVPDENGKWSGIDAAFCRSVAAAMFGDSDAVDFVPLTAKERFTALQTGAIDLLSRNSTWTLTRDVDLGADFVGVLFYDGQGFLVPTDLGIDHIEELNGATVCVLAGTTTELNLADYFRTHDLEYTPLTLRDSSQTITAFNAGRCDALTSDSSQLAALRTKLEDPSSAKILPELISKEPLSPSVAQGNPEWANVVQWTLFALVRAEELGITQANVDDMLESDNPKVKRLLGASGKMGDMLGLSDDWAYNVIKEIGNYGEIFDRTVGEDSPLNLPRGVNALWTDGGVQYAMPIR